MHVREANCHSLASYAAAASPGAEDDIEEMWRSVLQDQGSSVQVRTEVVEGLAPRVLLDRCADADMLVLGTASDVPGSSRSAGPVIRACLRRAPCPVVVISAAQEQIPRQEPRFARPTCPSWCRSASAGRCTPASSWRVREPASQQPAEPRRPRRPPREFVSQA